MPAFRARFLKQYHSSQCLINPCELNRSMITNQPTTLYFLSLFQSQCSVFTKCRVILHNLPITARQENIAETVRFIYCIAQAIYIPDCDDEVV